jgi:hypothetical protein
MLLAMAIFETVHVGRIPSFRVASMGCFRAGLPGGRAARAFPPGSFRNHARETFASMHRRDNF